MGTVNPVRDPVRSRPVMCRTQKQEIAVLRDPIRDQITRRTTRIQPARIPRFHPRITMSVTFRTCGSRLEYHLQPATSQPVHRRESFLRSTDTNFPGPFRFSVIPVVTTVQTVQHHKTSPSRSHIYHSDPEKNVSEGTRDDGRPFSDAPLSREITPSPANPRKHLREWAVFRRMPRSPVVHMGCPFSKREPVF